MLKKYQIITQNYKKDEDCVIIELSKYLGHIESWIKSHVQLSNNSTNATSANPIQIQEVCDIEELHYSPTYGIKAKFDLTVRAKIKNKNHVIPFEFKSGFSSLSGDHMGQVTVYALINREKSNVTNNSEIALLF